MLSSICADAVERGELQANPVTAVKWPSPPPQRAVRPLPPKDVERLRDAMPTERDALLVSLMAYAGLRPEEVLALTGPDLGRVIVVDKAVTHGKVKDTKNHKNRTVDVLAPLADDIEAFRKSLSVIPGPGAFAFPHPRDAGLPWGDTTYTNWQRRTFADAAERAGLPDTTPYDLRHSFVSLMLSAGIRRGEVAEQAGHSIQTMEKHYAHVIAEFRGVAMSDPAEAIRKARESLVSQRLGESGAT